MISPTESLHAAALAAYSRVLEASPELRGVSMFDKDELNELVSLLSERETDALEAYIESGLRSFTGIDRQVAYVLRGSKWLSDPKTRSDSMRRRIQ